MYDWKIRFLTTGHFGLSVLATKLWRFSLYQITSRSKVLLAPPCWSIKYRSLYYFAMGRFFIFSCGLFTHMTYCVEMCCAVDDVDMKHAIELPHAELDVLGTWRAHVYDSGSPVEDRQSIITAGGRRKRNCSPTRCWYARFPVFVEIVVDSTHFVALLCISILQLFIARARARTRFYLIRSDIVPTRHSAWAWLLMHGSDSAFMVWCGSRNVWHFTSRICAVF